MRFVVKFCMCFIIAGLFLLAPPSSVRAQEQASEPHSIMGCVQKGVEPGGFYLVAEDGMVWELAGKVESSHVGRKVTARGHVLHRSSDEEAKYTDYEKQEANGKKYADFQVTTLKNAPGTCQ